MTLPGMESNRGSGVPSDVDALVVGGGPAGATAAAFLATSGWSVLLLEKRLPGQEKVCGEFVSSEAVPFLRRLGVLEILRASGSFPIRSTRVLSADSRFDAPLPLSGSDPGFALSRATLDAILLSQARHLGAMVASGAQLLGLGDPEPRGRLVHFRISGSHASVRARIVIGADGRGSKVARLAGLKGRFSSPRLGLQIHLRRSDPPQDRVELLLLDKAYAGLVPVEGGRLTLGALLLPPAAPERSPWAALLEKCAAHSLIARPFAGSGDVLARGATYPVRFGLRTPTAPGLLLAGDAVGSVDPFSGQGIALALITGAAAAQTGEAMLISGNKEPLLRRRYAAFVRRQIGSRLWVCSLLRSIVDRPGAAHALMGFLGHHPEVARVLVGLTRPSDSLLSFAGSRFLAPLF